MFSRALARTFRTMRSPHFVSLLMKTAIITLVVFILFILGAGAGMRSFDLTGQEGWVEWVTDIMLTLGVGIVGWFLLPAVVPAIAAFFQESIADAIEEKDYPEFMPPAVQRPFWQEIFEDSKFVLLFLAVNIVCFPFFFFVPLVGQVAYYCVNGYFIGREFFETVSARHLGKKNAKILRKENPTPAFLCGILIVFCTNVPLLNLISPFIGVAIMVHLYHLLPKRAELLPPQKPDAAKAARRRETA